MRIFVIFGSKSDSNVYLPLIEKLEVNHKVEFEVISAHRDPIELENALRQVSYDLVVAGAGLAAHLPGVIASKIQKPVIGLPVAANFAGVDAFLSIVQMPFGVPVLSTAPNEIEEVVSFLDSVESCRIHRCNLVIKKSSLINEAVNRELERVKKFAKEEEIELNIVELLIEGEFNIIFVDRPEIFQAIGTNIYVPIMDESMKRGPEGAFQFFNLAKSGGVWIGANNSRNGLILFKKFKTLKGSM